MGGGGGGKVIFLEKCSLLVDRLGCTSECYIEVEQKGGAWPPGSPSGYAPAFGSHVGTEVGLTSCQRL